MANGNGVQPYEYSGSVSRFTDEFDRMGHPGKYHRCITVTSGSTVDFTGSNYGAGAILVENTATGEIVLSGTGSLDISHLASSTPALFELSIRRVSVTNHHVHVLIRNQIVR